MLFIDFLSVCFASLMNNGLWTNTLTLVNVLTAGLVATNYFEPLADLLDKQEPSLTYVWDFLAIWLIFGVVMIVAAGGHGLYVAGQGAVHSAGGKGWRAF